jgi:hypothetical protein
MMRALTICQPYASLIMGWPGMPFEIIKRVENRRWHTDFRGPLLIHAGTSRDWLDQWDGPVPEPMPFGVVLGRVLLSDCRHIAEILAADEKSPLYWIAKHRHTEGSYCWVLRRPCKARVPIAYRGQQGLWDFPDRLLQGVAWEPHSRKCGCTELDACRGGCSWVEPGLCSHCAGMTGEKGGKRGM